MTDREIFKNTFSHLHAAPDTLDEVLKKRVQKQPRAYSKRVVAVAIAACLLLTFGVTAYASCLLSRVFGWGGNSEVSFEPDENGNTYEEVWVNEEISEPVEFENGRMFFVVNNQHIDITDSVSTTKAFTYKYVDSDGYNHLWIVGLNDDDIKSYGFSEYYESPYGEGLGGFGVRADADGMLTNPAWLDDGLAKLGIAEP